MLNILGESLMAKGEYDDAVESLKRSIEISYKIYSDNSEDLGKISNPCIYRLYDRGCEQQSQDIAI